MNDLSHSIYDRLLMRIEDSRGKFDSRTNHVFGDLLEAREHSDGTMAQMYFQRGFNAAAYELSQIVREIACLEESRSQYLKRITAKAER